MSSHVTTVTISDQEWMEIQRCISDTTIYEARRREEIQRLQDQIREREKELENMRTQTNAVVESTVKMLEGEFAAALQSVKAETTEAVSSGTTGFKREMADLRQTIANTAAETSRLNASANALAQKFTEAKRALLDQIGDAQLRANKYLESLNSMLGRIKALSPEVFEPKTLGELELTIQSAQDNQSLPQSALIAAQNGIAKASGLLTRLIVANDTFDRELLKLTGQGDALKAKFDLLDLEGDIAFEIAGEQIKCEYDVDHWSHGRFSALKKEFEQTYRRLQEAKERKTPLESLRQIEAELDRRARQLEECDMNARKERIGSLNAHEMAERLKAGLESNGWRLEEISYEEDDDRNPLALVFKDGFGNTIPVVIAPGEEDENPVVTLEGFKEDGTSSDVIKRNAQAQLKSEGVDIVGKPVKLDDCKDNPDTDSFKKNTLRRATEQAKRRRKKRFS